MEKKMYLRLAVLAAFVVSFLRIFHGAGHDLIVIETVEKIL